MPAKLQSVSDATLSSALAKKLTQQVIAGLRQLESKMGYFSSNKKNLQKAIRELEQKNNFPNLKALIQFYDQLFLVMDDDLVNALHADLYTQEFLLPMRSFIHEFIRRQNGDAVLSEIKNLPQTDHMKKFVGSKMLSKVSYQIFFAEVRLLEALIAECSAAKLTVGGVGDSARIQTQLDGISLKANQAIDRLKGLSEGDEPGISEQLPTERDTYGALNFQLRALQGSEQFKQAQTEQRAVNARVDALLEEFTKTVRGEVQLASDDPETKEVNRASLLGQILDELLKEKLLHGAIVQPAIEAYLGRLPHAFSRESAVFDYYVGLQERYLKKEGDGRYWSIHAEAKGYHLEFFRILVSARQSKRPNRRINEISLELRKGRKLNDILSFYEAELAQEVMKGLFSGVVKTEIVDDVREKYFDQLSATTLIRYLRHHTRTPYFFLWFRHNLSSDLTDQQKAYLEAEVVRRVESPIFLWEHYENAKQQAAIRPGAAAAVEAKAKAEVVEDSKAEDEPAVAAEVNIGHVVEVLKEFESIREKIKTILKPQAEAENDDFEMSHRRSGLNPIYKTIEEAEKVLSSLAQINQRIELALFKSVAALLDQAVTEIKNHPYKDIKEARDAAEEAGKAARRLTRDARKLLSDYLVKKSPKAVPASLLAPAVGKAAEESNLSKPNALPAPSSQSIKLSQSSSSFVARIGSNVPKDVELQDMDLYAKRNGLVVPIDASGDARDSREIEFEGEAFVAFPDDGIELKPITRPRSPS